MRPGQQQLFEMLRTSRKCVNKPIRRFNAILDLATELDVSQ
jgi:hypothetical protein